MNFVSISALVLAMMISSFSLWSLRKSAFYKPSFLVNTINETSFDYIILGASTGLTTLNTKTIDSVLGTEGLNLSMDDTGLSSQYLMLQHFLNQGKTTKYCILAPSANAYDHSTNDVSDNDYRFLPFISETYVYDYYKAFSSKQSKVLKYSRWLPMLGVSYYNAELFYPSMITVIKNKKRNRFDDKGNYTYPNLKNSRVVINEPSNLNVSFKNKYVAKIKDLCASNNIELICYFSPVASKSISVNTSLYSIINHSDLIKDEQLFYDDIHVNSNGRQLCSLKFSEVFAKRINKIKNE
ncbi:hypothetical protein [uncultured Psychroserpens sp.]|uniref:hypothetical protein n=1 Tax=uncultured Psychroserpens sp. TaxID=255436 RepID=UPI002603A828|nr:hypothetical protein [uncultured Psychroserpens sp.]